ncbi:hypothetical protein HPB52_013395 [Rhipicephalus sanguineus]|uniref:Uncharacterized protein n=1 Tax=Rhipicephalus sanguineus TaxID=34632 RepID=A0A9D4QD60_RHISA|nr:hypothetical protein HPB52_013395 [Rhipicephalus sanguineus]
MQRLLATDGHAAASGAFSVAFALNGAAAGRVGDYSRQVSNDGDDCGVEDLPSEEFTEEYGWKTASRRDRAPATVKAAGLNPSQTDEGVISPNYQRNIVVAGTPERDNADKYSRGRLIQIGGKDFEVSAYETTPHSTCKGVISNIDACQ